MSSAASSPRPEPGRSAFSEPRGDRGAQRPFAEATPAQVRAALLPEEVELFDRDWRTALAEAAETHDLTVVFETLDSWRLIAWSTQADPAGHRRMLRTAEKVIAGEPVPTVPAGQIKALIRERLGLQLYEVDTSGEARDQIAALPTAGLAGFLEVLSVLELVPWNGAPYNKNRPDGVMRMMLFGPRHEGLCVYLIDDQLRRVEVLRVLWSG